MATKSENSEIAVLQSQMEEIKATLQELKQAIFRIESAGYVTKSEFDRFKKQYWLSHSVTALFTALISVIVYLAFGAHR